MLWPFLLLKREKISLSGKNCSPPPKICWENCDFWMKYSIIFYIFRYFESGGYRGSLQEFGLQMLATSLKVEPSRLLPMKIFTDTDLTLHQQQEQEKQASKKQSGTSECSVVGCGPPPPPSLCNVSTT